jgi:KUP system potassium uptake protein
MVIVLPCLALNYLGQGALVLADPSASANPFYLLVPEWALVPMVILATIATVIASQAVITGAYSMTRQAMQLGLLPRLEVRHTSESHSGQIYIPRVNTLLLVGVILLVLGFKSSSALASIYGISVTGAMMVDAIMAFIVIWKAWKYSPWLSGLLIMPFFAIESVFFGANLMKVADGGWVPLVLCAGLLTTMLTWRRGSRILFEKTRKLEVPLKDLVRSLEARPPHIVSGTAVFLTSDPESAPTALLHNLKHNKVLHAQNVILTIKTKDIPRVDEEERITVDQISHHFVCVTMRFGFMETPNVPKGLAQCRKCGWQLDLMTTSFFL